MNKREFANYVIEEAYHAKTRAKSLWLPASIMAGQAYLETGGGQKVPEDTVTKKKSFNCLGIKARPKRGWVGNNGYVTCGTHEEVKGNMIFLPKAHFRAYTSYSACFTDYIKIIRRSRKAGKKRYQRSLDNRTDPKEYIKYLAEDGYVTDSSYANKVIDIAKQFNWL